MKTTVPKAKVESFIKKLNVTRTEYRNKKKQAYARGEHTIGTHNAAIVAMLDRIIPAAEKMTQ